MFAYGIQHALDLGLVNGNSYNEAVKFAYRGLREYSIATVHDGYLTSKNVCKATCIGNKSYYFKRGTQKGKAYGLASFIQFGRLFERTKQ
jgi:rhamnogalacturonyl hydrolase YesR